MIWSCVVDFSIICDVVNMSGYCRLGGSKFFNHKSVFVFSFSIMVYTYDSSAGVRRMLNMLKKS